MQRRRAGRIIPAEKTSQNIGLMSANTRIVGASNCTIPAVSTHFGPSTSATTSWEKTAHTIVTGTVRATDSE